MFSSLKSPDWARDGADWPHRAASRFIEAGDYHWHTQRFGEGPTALLLHGTGASTHSWADLMSLMAPSFDVLAIDLPGHGFTRTKRWSPPSLRHIAEQMSRLLDALRARPALIIGHSAGAAIAMRLAVSGETPPAALVSVNGALAPFGGAAGFLFPAMAKALYYNPLTAYAFAQGARDDARVRKLIEQTGSRVPEINRQRYATLLRRPGHVAGALGMMAHWDLSTMASEVARLGAPSWFIAGAEDRAVAPETAREMATRAERGRAIELEGLGHLAHEEAPARVRELIAEVASQAGID